MSVANPVLEVLALGKRYGATVALRDVSFHAEGRRDLRIVG